MIRELNIFEITINLLSFQMEVLVMEQLWENVQAGIVIIDAFQRENAMSVNSSQERTKGAMIPRQHLSVIMILL